MKIIRTLWLLSLCVVSASVVADTMVFTGRALSEAEQQAFEHVKANVASLVEITVPLVVNINDLSDSCNTSVLANASPMFFIDRSGLPQPNTFYPIAFIKNNTDVDLAPLEQDLTYDIRININSCTAWNYTADPVAHQYSFIDVMTHEIVHGLGFTELKISGRLSQFGLYLGPSDGEPAEIFASEQARNEADKVFWQGAKAAQMYPLINDTHNVRPPLYQPFAGDSVAHFNNVYYSSGEQELMNPTTSNGARVKSLLTAAIFCDMGWRVTSDYDGDGIDDCSDDLPLTYNVVIPPCDPEQQLCAEPLPNDADGDGVVDIDDNCLINFNPRQLDRNGDDTGDACVDPVELPAQWGEMKQQQFGAVLATAGDMDGDGYHDYWVGSPQQQLVAQKKIKAAGAVYLISGKTNERISAVKPLLGSSANAQFGAAIIGNIDVDHDGCIDTFISAPNEMTSVTVDGKSRKFKAAGAVYRYSPFVKQNDKCEWQADAALVRIYAGQQAKAQAGFALGLLPAADDSTSLLIGEPGRSAAAGQKFAGAVTAVTLTGDQLSTVLFEGKMAGERAGSHLAVGRYDGENAQIAVLAPGVKAGKQRGGIYWLTAQGQPIAERAQPSLLDAQYAGCPLSGPATVIKTRTALDVLAAASPMCKLSLAQQGAVWLFHGESEPVAISLPQAKLKLGAALSAADINADGAQELIVSGAQAEVSGKKVLPNAGRIAFYDLRRSQWLKPVLSGTQKNEQLGCALLGAAIDDDRHEDLIFAHCGASLAKLPRTGKTQLLLGRKLQLMGREDE